MRVLGAVRPSRGKLISMRRADPKQKKKMQTRLLRRKRARVAPPGFVTRGVLMEKVGLTEGQIRSLIAAGEVEAEGENSDGYAYYSEKLVERLLIKKADGSLFRRARSAALASADMPVASYSSDQGVKVFELLSARVRIEQIVLQTKIHPLVVKRIREDFDDMSQSIHLPREVVDRLNGFKNLPGAYPLTDAAGVLDVFEQCSQNRLCSMCSKFDSVGLCEVCLNADRRSERKKREEAAATAAARAMQPSTSSELDLSVAPTSDAAPPMGAP